MPTPPMALEERARRKAAVEDALKAGYPPPDLAQRGGSSALQQASIALNIAYGTISTWLKRERQHKASGEEHYEPDWSLYKLPKPRVTITAAMQQGAVPLPWEAPDGRDTQRLRDEVQRLRTELKNLQREANASDDLREAVFDLAQSPLSPPAWVFDDEQAQHPAGVPLLFGSDEQFGEVIRSDEVNGINEFNVEVAARRIRRKFERTVDICFNHMVNPDYPGIVYCRGGDAVSGDIHQELRETNELTSHEQLLHLAELEVAGIRALLDHFPRVVVLSVPGNHGRCVEESTEVLTPTGWVKASSVKAGDQVASVDVQTGLVHYSACLGVNRFSERGAWKIVGRYHDELVSRDHNVAYAGGLTPASTLPDEMKAGDFFRATQVAEAHRENEDYVRLLAWAVFDGTVVDRRRQGESGFRLQWRLKRERKIGALLALLDRSDVPHTVRQSDGVSTISVYGEWAKRVAGDVLIDGSKGLPQWFARLGCVEAKAFLETIAQTDGRPVGTQCVEWSSVDGRNVGIVQALCVANGIPFRSTLNGNPSGYANRKPIYICHFQPDGMAPRSCCHRVTRQWVGEEFSFVGIQTEHGTLVTRRNGKACVTGNSTIKPVSKRYSDTNYDRLCALFIEREFKGDDRVVFYTPKSGDAYFSVYGKRFLLTHGDRIGSRGGQGFIGPVATIARGVHKTRQQFDAINKPVDYMLIGHFHTLMQIAHCFVNGSVPGFSEYANQLRFSPEPPQQWLLFVHPRRGITCRWPIQLEDEPGHDAPWFDCVA